MTPITGFIIGMIIAIISLRQKTFFAITGTIVTILAVYHFYLQKAFSWPLLHQTILAILGAYIITIVIIPLLHIIKIPIFSEIAMVLKGGTE